MAVHCASSPPPQQRGALFVQTARAHLICIISLHRSAQRGSSLQERQLDKLRIALQLRRSVLQRVAILLERHHDHLRIALELIRSVHQRVAILR